MLPCAMDVNPGVLPTGVPCYKVTKQNIRTYISNIHVNKASNYTQWHIINYKSNYSRIIIITIDHVIDSSVSLSLQKGEDILRIHAVRHRQGRLCDV